MDTRLSKKEWQLAKQVEITATINQDSHMTQQRPTLLFQEGKQKMTTSFNEDLCFTHLGSFDDLINKP